MRVYVITLLLVGLFALVAQNNKVRLLNRECSSNSLFRFHFFVILTAIVLVFVAGFRYRVGTDYMNYALGYEQVKVTFWDSLKTLDEPGYKLLTIIGSWIYDDYASMFFIIALFTIGKNIKTMSRYSDDFFFAIIIYILIGAWHGSFGAMRQYAASAILFAGHHYIYEKKFWHFLLTVAVAFLFHRTAIIFVVVYFIAKDYISIKSMLLMIIIAIAATLSLDKVFEVMSYFKGTDQTAYAYMTTDVNPLRVIMAFLPLLLIFLIPKQDRNKPEIAFYFNMLIINAIFMLVTSSSAYLARIGIYTDIYATIAFPKLKSHMSNNNRKAVVFLVIILYGFFWIYEIQARETLQNFQWIFFR